MRTRIYFLIMKNKFASRLKELREEKNLSQKKLADALGLFNADISRYERGLQIPSIETIIKFCDFFGCTSDYLIGIKDD